ncbi:UDP-N-acetylmuramoyl-tripeptide--D-alanyl-D-alanine ligase [Priestia aryabhattai]
MLKNILGFDVTNVHFNSKEIKPGGLFVPLKGGNSDGHKYIKSAIQNGAVASLWNEEIPVPQELDSEIKFIKVKDTLQAFQHLANYHRKEINPIIIGITGSNGKTTTKEIVAAALSTLYKVHKNTGNYNNHIGVPLTLLSMPDNTELCIVEMGMNHKGEIRTLSNIAQPNIAIITNIGESHIGHLGSRANIAKAKMEIIEGLINKNNIIYDGDESLLSELSGYPVYNKDINKLRQLDNKIMFEYLGEKVTLPAFGLHNAKNTAFAIVLSSILKVKMTDVLDGLSSFQNNDMRLELKKIGTTSFLVDCYNSSLTSLKSALDTFDNINTTKKKIAILGDIFELGTESKDTHKLIGEMTLCNFDFEYWFVGENMKVAYEVHSQQSKNKYFENTELLLEYILLNQDAFNNTFILLKASRGMRLESVLNAFHN